MKNQKSSLFLGVLPLLGLAGCGAISFDRDPTVTHATRLNVAMAAEASGDNQMALQLYAAAVAKNPGDTNAVVLYARALVNARRIALARELLSRQLDAQPGQADLARELATIDVLQGQPAQALPRFDLALSKNPNDVRALVNKAIALDMMGNHNDAQGLYLRADALSPGDDSIRNNLAMSMALAGRSQDASQMMQGMAEGPVAVPRIRNNMAVLAASSGDMARARQISNGEITEAELTALAAQIRAREAAPVAAAPPVAEVRPVAMPAAEQVAPSPLAVPAGAPVALQVPGAETAAEGQDATPGRRPRGEKAQPARATPAPAKPAGRNNMTALDRKLMASVERAAEREMVDAVLAAAITPTAGPAPIAQAATREPEGAAVLPVMAVGPVRLRVANLATETPAGPVRAASATRMGYGVQLGALDSERMAQFTWRRLSARISLLEGREGHVSQMTRAADGRVFYRLRTFGFPHRQAAEEFCGEIKAQGVDCFASRT